MDTTKITIKGEKLSMNRGIKKHVYKNNVKTGGE